MSTVTDANGRFSVTNIQGKRLGVMVWKKGYHQFKSAYQSFEYSCIFESNFHIPDPTNPVVFRLWEFMNPEPLYHRSVPQTVLSLDDTPVWVDVQTGRVGGSGQVALSVLRANPTNWLAGYTITIRAAEGGGVKLAEKNDELMFEAPDSGYEPMISIVQAAGDEFSNGKGLYVYVRTPDNKYGSIKIGVTQYNNGKADMDGGAYFNPSGSRNLQYREELRLDVKKPAIRRRPSK